LFSLLAQLLVVIPVAASTYSTAVLNDGAIGYWRLGETSGTTAADASPSGNPGTYTGSYTLGQPGAIYQDTDTAVKFTGGYVDINQSTSLMPPTALSVEAWVKPTSTADGTAIFASPTVANPYGNSGYMLYFTAGRLRMYVAPNVNGWTYAEAPPIIPLNIWTYVVGTWDGSNIRIYLNGTLQATAPALGIAYGTPTANALIAKYAGGGTLSATVDEVAVYGTALSQTQISNHYNIGGHAPGAPTGIRASPASPGLLQAGVSWTAPSDAGNPPLTGYTITSWSGGSIVGTTTVANVTSATVTGLTAGTAYTFTVHATNPVGDSPESVASNAVTPSSASAYASQVETDGPVGYWRLGETAGTIASDSSPNANTGTYTGLYSQSQPGALDGDTDTSLTLSGGYVDINRSSTLMPPAALSVEGWVNPTVTLDGTALFASPQQAAPFGNGGYMLYFAQGRPRMYTAPGIGGWNYAEAPDTLPLNKWTYLVGTWDGSKVSIYVNGVLQSSATANTITYGTPSVDAYIGKYAGASTISGGVDEVAVYSRALSAAEVRNHYQQAGLVGGDVSAAQAAGGGANDCLVCQVHGNYTASPVDTATGNFWHNFSDFSIPGRSYPLSFARTYNSQAAGTNGPLGYGWQFNNAMSLSVSGSTATITQENGSQASFTQSGPNWNPSAPRFIATLTHNGDGTWTFVRFNRDTYKFNAAGQMISATDLNGYTTNFGYTTGNLTSVTDPAGRTLAIGWTGSVITSVTDSNVTPARGVTFQYNDGAGNLTDAFDVAGGHWKFTYETGSRRMLTMLDPKCFATPGCLGVQNTYDASGRISTQRDQLNRQTTFDYTSIPNGTKVTDPKGNVTVDFYSHGLRSAVTKGYGTADAATWQYLYDRYTLALTQVTDPNGNRTFYTVDANGNVLSTTDALNRKTSNTYNSLNQVLTATDGNGVATTNTYDTRGNLTSTSRPLTGTAQTQATTYNHIDAAHPGDVTSMVDPDSKTWTYTYDGNGYRNSVQDMLTNKSTYVFNNDGWMTSSVSPKGNVAGCGCASQYTTIYGYNAFGQRTSLIDPNSHTTRWHYDPDQNLDTLTDADGNVTIYVYDLANQQTQIQRADTPQTTLITDYNPDGTVLDQKDGKGTAILTYGYNSLARVTSTTDALNNVTNYAYDGAGNRLTKQDPGGNCAATPKVGCTTYSYNADNELTGITYSDGVTPNVSNITYDNDGQRTGMTDGTGTSTWVWDSLHRLTSYTNGNGAQVQWGYNLRNLVTTIIYPGNLAVTRGYDDAGRWISVRDWNSNNTTFGYDPNSNLTTETLPTATGVVDTFTFDRADQLMATSVTKGATTLFSATYSRDNANQLSSDSSAPPSIGSYKYNPLNQICYAGSSNGSACSAPPSGAIAYAYDAADNLTQSGGTQQVFNVADQLCWTAATSGACATPPAGATRYTYDLRGNRTNVTPPTGPAITLGYDQANRLTSYAAATNTTYTYNGDGLRMSKTTGASTSQFVWDSSSSLPLLLKDGATAYVYGPGGLPLEQVTGATTYYLHHDQLGSTRLLTDATGATQATYSYDPYGKLVAISGSIINPLQFAGQYTDSESGFQYLRARYYDPVTGQFITRDPVVTMTRQAYSYSANSPTNRSDPSGLCSPLPGCLTQSWNNFQRAFVDSMKITPIAPGVSYGYPAAVSAAYVLGAAGAFEIGSTLLLGGRIVAAENPVLGVGMALVGVGFIIIGAMFLFEAAVVAASPRGRQGGSSSYCDQIVVA
jgi:RHS repeat-associated protein